MPVYFIQHADDGPIKVGYTQRPESAIWEHRLAELQVGNPYDLHLLAVAVHGGPALERALHSALDGMRVRGEWFKPEPILRRVVQFYQDNPYAGLPTMRDALAVKADASTVPTWKELSRVAAGRPWLASPEDAARVALRRAVKAERAAKARRGKARRQELFAAAVAGEDVTLRIADTVRGECVSCAAPRPVLSAGPDAGCHVAGSACEHCGHVEPA